MSYKKTKKSDWTALTFYQIDYIHREVSFKGETLKFNLHEKNENTVGKGNLFLEYVTKRLDGFQDF